MDIGSVNISGDNDDVILERDYKRVDILGYMCDLQNQRDSLI